ncbi:MAG: hypothetical protein ACK4ND_07385 [Cytophagaceae bacterium]
MNKQKFIELLQNPQGIEPSELKALEDLIKNFPYCQAAHILLSKGTHEHGGMLAEQKLKTASAYTSDRKNLKNIILNLKSPENSQPGPSPSFKAPINNDQQPKNEKTLPKAVVLEPELVEAGPAIISLQEEPFKEDLFREIEDNLKKLHELRKKTGNFSRPLIISDDDTEETKEIPKAKKEVKADNLVSPAKSKKSPDKHIKEEAKEKSKTEEEPISTAKHYITSSRFEDILISGIEEKETTDADLLSGYLEYIKEKGVRYKKDKKAENDIIERFIREEPSIPQLSSDKIEKPQEDLASKGLKASKYPVSENFAKMMTRQGKTDKAIEIYKQLILKYPEKSTYFASQIENLTNNN